MLDRQKIETVLTRRFAGATHRQIAAAANAIMGLGDEWEEILDESSEVGYHFPGECRDICHLAREFHGTAEIRLFRRREA